MKRTGFKTRPSTYCIELAPTSRAKCRLCKQSVIKGDARVVTRAFVRPGRTRDFVCHLRCMKPALVRAMLSVYGSVDHVPLANEIDADTRKYVRAQFENATQ